MLLALAGFASLSLGDGIVKSMVGSFPGSGIAALRYVFGLAGLLLVVVKTRGRAGFLCPRPALQLARGAAVSAASFGFFVGIQFMPLANATAITFTTPMFAALFSVIILKERITRAVWIASLLAFAGVVIILRPQFGASGLEAIYPLGAAMSMALLMIFNRMTAGIMPLLESQFLITAFATPILIITAVVLHFSGLRQFQLHMPSAIIALKCACVAVTGTTSHWLIFMATQRASAALTAPMMYVQILVATVIGAVFFGNMPTAATFAGAGIIIAGGLYLGGNMRQRAEAGHNYCSGPN